ncbi:MAG: hypothetical protein HY554_14450 [Elusimicrobia bacterium]|nr:hypothetical protein [Elusimicrobiota bacterium]
MASEDDRPPYVVWFDRIGLGDLAAVGGKNASLGELVRELGARGVRVPDGFAVAASGYRHFVRAAGLEGLIERESRAVDVSDDRDVALDRG